MKVNAPRRMLVFWALSFGAGIFVGARLEITLFLWICCGMSLLLSVLMKYGKQVGRINVDVKTCYWVHCHNVDDITEQHGDGKFQNPFPGRSQGHVLCGKHFFQTHANFLLVYVVRYQLF